MKAVYLLLISFSILSFSCENDNVSMNKDILVGTWKLDSVYFKNKDEVKHYPDSFEKWVSIEIIDSSIAELNGYCNKGFADYYLKEKQISFSNVGLSELICFGVGGVWEAYLYELANAATYELVDRRLIIYTDSNFNLYFSKKENRNNDQAIE